MGGDGNTPRSALTPRGVVPSPAHWSELQSSSEEEGEEEAFGAILRETEQLLTQPGMPSKTTRSQREGTRVYVFGFAASMNPLLTPGTPRSGEAWHTRAKLQSCARAGSNTFHRMNFTQGGGQQTLSHQ